MSALRISESQAKLLFGQKAKASQKKATVRRKRSELPENIAESHILDFLRLRGWEATRQQVGTFVAYRQFAELRETGRNNSPVIPIRIGMPRMCDWKLTRLCSRELATIECFELEVKAPGKKPDGEQMRYIDNRNALGMLATWSDGLEGSSKPFREWYESHFSTSQTNE